MDKAIITHYYLVDSENVGFQGLYGISLPKEDSEIMIFLSNASHTGTVAVQREILRAKAKVGTLYCSEHGKNAMDFALSAYFGAALERPATSRISIISRDAGYKALKDYAFRTRKSVVVYQASSVIEAYSAAEMGFHRNEYEKSQAVDFRQIMKDRAEKQKAEAPFRAALAGYDAETVELVLEGIGRECSAKEKYLSLMKLLGRAKGLEIYRIFRNCPSAGNAGGTV